MNSRTRRVLAYANRVRRFQGLRPLKRMPKGRRMAAGSCPIAQATHARSVIQGRIRLSHDVPYRRLGELPQFHLQPASSSFTTRHITPPKYVDQWITDFDAGKYPELIER